MSSFDIGRRNVLSAGLKAARNRAGLSANEAASLLVSRGIPCKRGTLLAWERGSGQSTREPYASDLTMIASVYGCSVDEFFNPASRALLTRSLSNDGEE